LDGLEIRQILPYSPLFHSSHLRAHSDKELSFILFFFKKRKKEKSSLLFSKPPLLKGPEIPGFSYNI
jgi:hypothetical protein